MEGSEMSFSPMRGAHSGVSVQIFSDDLSMSYWANAGWGPTTTRITDSTESALVLGHDDRHDMEMCPCNSRKDSSKYCENYSQMVKVYAKIRQPDLFMNIENVA